MSAPGLRRLALALAVGTVVAAPIEAAPSVRQCGFSYSPDGNHVALFSWRGGSRVELVVCDFSCSPLRAYDRNVIRSYRWEAPGVIVVFDTRTRVRQPIATYRGVHAFAAPVSAAAGGDLHPVRIGRRTCFRPESVTVEDSPEP
jgi:hypothetical protein